MRRAILLSLVLLALAVEASQSYWVNGPSWPSGTVRVQIELGSSPALTDGCEDWSCAVSGAVDRWNAFMGRVQLRAIANSRHAKGELNGRNDMFFANDMYGKAFGSDTLALTTWWYRDDTLIETDIGVNQAKRWDSYRGNARPGLVYDLRRVALHELGHVLGLGHPDDHGQHVVAMMNSRIGDLDGLTTDDITGIQSIYGPPAGDTGETGGSGGATIDSPPRDETYDPRDRLDASHAARLGRTKGSSYSDVESSGAWVLEYLRYRLNGCTHAQSVAKVTDQIEGRGVPAACR